MFIILIFTDKVIHHNPLLPGLPVHPLPDLNHDQTDHNTKPMEHYCIISNSSVNQLLLHEVITLPANTTGKHSEQGPYLDFFQ